MGIKANTTKRANIYKGVRMLTDKEYIEMRRHYLELKNFRPMQRLLKALAPLPTQVEEIEYLLFHINLLRKADAENYRHETTTGTHYEYDFYGDVTGYQGETQQAHIESYKTNLKDLYDEYLQLLTYHYYRMMPTPQSASDETNPCECCAWETCKGCTHCK